MMLRTMFRFVILAVLAMSVQSPHAADWPKWRGPEGNAISKETGLLKQWPAEGPKKVWEAPLGPGYASVTVAGGKAFTMYQDDEGEYAAAFDEKTGNPLWKTKTGGIYKSVTNHNGPRSTPTVEGDVVFVMDGLGNLLCLKVADGKEVWKKNILEVAGAQNIMWGMAGSPFIIGDLLVTNPGGPNGNSIIAFNKKSGDVVWKSGSQPAGYSTPVPYKDGEQLVVFTKTGPEGVMTKDGKQVWSANWANNLGINAADPIVNGDQVFVCTGYGKGSTLLKPSDGKVDKVWASKQFSVNFGQTPMLVDGYLYGSNENNTLVCVDFKTGKDKWSQSGISKGQFVYADGMFILFSENGDLSLMKMTPEKATVVSKVKFSPGQQRWASPVIANGKLFLRDDKKLYCLDVTGK